jgi:hypothetical protein
MVLNTLSVKFLREPKSILDTSDQSKKGGTWFQGAVLNIAECCLLPWPSQNKTDDSTAIVWRDEGLDDYPVNRMSLKELRTQVMYASLIKLKVWSIHKPWILFVLFCNVHDHGFVALVFSGLLQMPLIPCSKRGTGLQ